MLTVAGGRPNGNVREKYKHLHFVLLRGYDLELRVGESVKPMAQHVRRFPFGVAREGGCKA